MVVAANAGATTVPLVQNDVNDTTGGAVGAVSASAWLETGSAYSTVTAPADSGNYRFTYWSVDAYPTNTYRDAWGRSENPISFVLLEETTATAHYLPFGLDEDADGVPNWYELEYYGTLTNGASYDGDGDSLSMASEYAGGTHPLYANTSDAGGVFSSSSGLIVCNLAGYASYTLRSDPSGSINQSEFVPPGTRVTTPDLSGNASFGFWTVNGVRQQDAWGAAYPQVTFVVQTNDVEGTAHLFAGDTDGDGIPDAYEQYMFGTLTNSATSDADGDGLTLAQEYSGGSNPLYGNTSQPGGVFWADSALVTCNLAGYSHYFLRSEPAGRVDESATVTTGTVVTTPDMQQADFGYWTLNGVRQEDQWGMALRQITFVVQTNDVEAVAWFFEGDSDGDGVGDAAELYYYGSLTNDAASDTDGDGIGLKDEIDADTNPRFGNSFAEGGVFWDDSPLLTVNLQFFRRVPYSLVNGIMQPFFSADTSVTGLFSIAANSHPALGDWDGDGDLDLFVGGSNGWMRVFENAGSPTVINWVERTTDFTFLDCCLPGILNPAPSLGDWNHDGRADLAVGGDVGLVWLFDSDGVFTSPVADVLTRVVTGGEMAIPAFMDADGDGWTDLLVLNELGFVQCYTNTHSMFAPYTNPPISTDLLGTPVPNARGITATDVNGDGLTDVLISDDYGNVWEFHGGAP